MDMLPGWQGLQFVLAQITIGEMGTITAMSVTISSAIFYIFRAMVSSDMRKELDERYVSRPIAAKESEYLEYQLQQQRLQYERILNSLQEAFRQIDEQQRILAIH